MKIVTPEGNRVAFAVHVEVPEEMLLKVARGEPLPGSGLSIAIDCFGLDEFVAMDVNPSLADEIAKHVRRWLAETQAEVNPRRVS